MNKKILREHSVAVDMKRLDEARLADQEGAISAWTAPVWNIGKLNLNGRVYTKELADRIVAENRATIVYDSHESDYGSAYSNVVAVAKNPRIEQEQLWADIFMVDEIYSRKIEAIHRAGVGIGVSSVGYGETDKDGVVNAQTYELVRYMDFVVDPANETYANPEQSEPVNKNESVENDHESDKVLPEGTEEPSEEIKERIETYKRLEALETKE